MSKSAALIAVILFLSSNLYAATSVKVSVQLKRSGIAVRGLFPIVLIDTKILTQDDRGCYAFKEENVTFDKFLQDQTDDEGKVLFPDVKKGNYLLTALYGDGMCSGFSIIDVGSNWYGRQDIQLGPYNLLLE